MSIVVRHYEHPHDYQGVSDFLVAHYRRDNLDGNWLQPTWEYMHGHPYLDQSSLEKIGIWEDDGEMVGVAHYESRVGEAFFEVHPNYTQLKRDMLDYAERHVGETTGDGKRCLHAFVNDLDDEFTALVKAQGYERVPAQARPMCRFRIPNPFPDITLPDGFRLTSLAEDCDWKKVHRVMWRGFNHAGEPSAGNEALEERERMFDTPTARRDLKIAVQAPDGSFVAFCGMFYEPHNRYAYVEPVATDPDFRRMGLGKAAVLEGIRRCSTLGATVAYVGNELPIYQSIGFERIFTSECWAKCVS